MTKPSQHFPLGNRVIILRDERSTKTDQGIFLPETSKKEKLNTGMITAVGGGVEDRNLRVAARVMFHPHAGSPLPNDGSGDYLLLDVQDILTIVNDE